MSTAAAATAKEPPGILSVLPLKEFFSLDVRSLALFRIGLGIMILLDWIDRLPDLAAQLSAFPQLCMRNDRLSALDQWSLDWGEAQAREIVYGMETLRSGASREGAARLAAGEGRGGRF